MYSNILDMHPFRKVATKEKLFCILEGSPAMPFYQFSFCLHLSLKYFTELSEGIKINLPGEKSICDR